MTVLKADGYCKWCGKKIPEGARSIALYDSPACKQAAYRYRNQPDVLKWDLSCAWCGVKFKSVYWRMYHNDACKQAAYRARKKAGAQAMF